ncbi:MAG: zinc metalloprotease HtpX [Dehalococcoidia bacterium]|nr:zinc metalloprotease HtpX [Dehalococcoidia bacterium]
MRRKWYGRDTGLAVRMFIVMFLLAAVYLFFLTAMWAAGLDFFAIGVIAAILLGAQYFLSDKLVLWSMGAHVVDSTQAPHLHAMVERLAAMADLPKPKIAMVDTDIPNAFATGRSPKHAVIAVTTGLLDRLDQPEVEAVLAHELTHVRNRDVAVITIASFFATVAQFILRFSMFGSFRGRRGRDGQSVVVVYLVSLLVWIVSFFLIRALSRYREYAADRGSAIITGAPAHLEAALVKISGTMQRIPQQDLRKVDGMNAFFIVPALKGSSFMELFSTHPSMEKRLARLKRMQQEMETGI